MVLCHFNDLGYDCRWQGATVPLGWATTNVMVMLEPMIPKCHRPRLIPPNREAGTALGMITSVHLRASVRNGVIGDEKRLGIKIVPRFEPISQKKTKMKCRMKRTKVKNETQKEMWNEAKGTEQ
jgi:hypothetical protein